MQRRGKSAIQGSTNVDGTSLTGGLTRPSQLYIVALALFAVGITVSSLARGATLEWERALLAVVLTVLAVAANLYPLQFSPKTKVTLDTAVVFAGVLLLDIGVAMLLAGASSILADVARRRPSDEVLFNGSQLALQAGAGGLVLAGAGWSTHQLILDGPEQVLILAVVAVVMYIVNTFMVAVIVALQSDLSALHVWCQSMVDLDRFEHLSYVSQVGLGLTTAIIADAHPWMLPLLLLPAIATYRLLECHIRLQEETINAALELAIAEERGRLAHEMHDGVAHVLSYVNVKAQIIQELLRRGQAESAENHAREIMTTAQEAYSDVREDILGLRMSSGDSRGLHDSLTEYLGQWEEQSGVPAQLIAEPGDFGLHPATELQLMRIVQEALANVRKHARATSVRVQFSRTPGCLDVVIEDNGTGFDPAAPERSRFPRFGLAIMRERAGAVGGRIKVDSIPAGGTRVVVRIPTHAAGTAKKGGDHALTNRRRPEVVPRGTAGPTGDAWV